MKTAQAPLHERGFTLVEIMVVIAVIGILSTVAFYGFNGAREQARDKTRAASLQQLQVAIETYRADKGEYPDAGCPPSNTWVGPGPMAGIGSSCDEYIDGLVPNYIAALPTDPKDELLVAKGFMYRVEDNAGINTAYKLMVFDTVESQGPADYPDRLARCPYDCSDGGACDGAFADSAVNKRTYAVYSDGAQCW